MPIHRNQSLVHRLDRRAEQAVQFFHRPHEDFVANGDKVLVRSTIRATQKGDFAGIKATGKSITLMAMDLHQICNGRVAQTWHVEDWLSAMFQMGALPPKN